MVHEAYGDVFDDVLPVEVKSCMYCVFGNDADWDLGDIPWLKDADVSASLPVYIKAIQP